MSENGTGAVELLNIDDLLEERVATWTFKGVRYEYVRWSMLGLLERRRIVNRQKRIDELEALEDPGEEDAESYRAAVRELVAIVTPTATPDVIDAMTEDQRAEVVTRFLALRLLRISDMSTERSAAIAKWVGQPITVSSSPASTPAGRKGKKRG